jgi:hypothetical protein
MALSIDIQSLKPVTIEANLVSTQLNLADYLGAIKVRWGIGRDRYRVMPGLYKVGNPDSKSDVFVSANYKLSFDVLRKNMGSLNAWILVIDTNGINVWCAAGKGTFGTDNIVKSVKNTLLENVVEHRTLILPQLGAVGVAAHKVKEQCGFKVVYGPIRAKDIKAFIRNGYKATPDMRKMTFPIYERAKLIPVDLMYGKYKLLIALAVMFILSGLDRTGFLFSKMINLCPLPILNVLGAYLAGIVLAPLFLSWVPFRAFALKGAFWGAINTLAFYFIFHISILEIISFGFISMAVASFMTMNFTGSSTYTSLSGVKKEMKWAIPLQIVFAAVGIILFVIFKLI